MFPYIFILILPTAAAPADAPRNGDEEDTKSSAKGKAHPIPVHMEEKLKAVDLLTKPTKGFIGVDVIKKTSSRFSFVAELLTDLTLYPLLILKSAVL